MVAGDVEKLGWRRRQDLFSRKCRTGRRRSWGAFPSAPHSQIQREAWRRSPGQPVSSDDLHLRSFFLQWRLLRNRRSWSLVCARLHMAGDVWRWCQVHQKWLQDVNVKVTRSGLQHDRGDGSSSILLHSSPSSRSFSSTRQDCLERMGKKPSGNAAASSRWQDDGRTLDPVPPSPRYTAAKGKKSGPPSQESGAALRSLPRDLGLGLPDYARPQEGSTDVGNVWPQSRSKIRPVRWLFAETPMQNTYCENVVEGDNWVTVFSSNPVRDGTGGGASRFGTGDLNQVLREFEKCGTIVERVVGPDGGNWVQIQYQSPREAGQALMKSGLRLKGGLTVVVRSLDERQRKQLLLETISKYGNHSAGQSSTYMPLSYGPVDLDVPKAEEGPPKSSVSKFVDLVFDCERDFQISPAGYIIPIRFEPGLYKELFKSQVHRCDAFVTPLCDPAANQPLYFEYPRKSVDPCEYAQNKLDELRNMVGEELSHFPPCDRSTFRPTGKSVCGGSAWWGSDFGCDSQQRSCGCPERPEPPECPECPE